MRKITCAVIVLASLLRTYGQTPAQEIDELLKEYTKQNIFNGVALVAQKGKILLEKGYGYKNVATKTPNDTNTIFQIGSITKQFTAAIILQLQEQHRLSVQDRLSKYIPDYPGGDSMTLEHLLTHTSGIYNYTQDETMMRSIAGNSIRTDSLIAKFKYK